MNYFIYIKNLILILFLFQLLTGQSEYEKWLKDQQQEMAQIIEDENNYIFMDAITYEQKYISKDIIGEKGLFLKDGMEVILNLFEDETISVQLPDTVIMEVVEADAVVKGQTASSSYKPGIIENGLRVMVPPHIEVGTKIVIKTEDFTYVEKAKG